MGKARGTRQWAAHKSLTASSRGMFQNQISTATVISSKTKNFWK